MLHAYCLSRITILSCYACKVPAYYAFVFKIKTAREIGVHVILFVIMDILILYCCIYFLFIFTAQSLNFGRKMNVRGKENQNKTNKKTNKTKKRERKEKSKRVILLVLCNFENSNLQ